MLGPCNHGKIYSSLDSWLQFGFGLARAPEELSKALRDAIRGGLERGEARYENKVEVIEGPRCLFIDRKDLTERVSSLLRPPNSFLLRTNDKAIFSLIGFVSRF